MLSVVHGRQKVDKDAVLELLPSEQPFEPVIQQRAEPRPRRTAATAAPGKRPSVDATARAATGPSGPTVPTGPTGAIGARASPARRPW